MRTYKYSDIQPENEPKPCVEDILAELIQLRYSIHRDPFDLRLVQQPVEGRAAGKTEKGDLVFSTYAAKLIIAVRGTKWPIDPPPVIEFVVKDNDKSRAYLQSPFWFCTAELEPVTQRSGPLTQASLLSGCLVSSLHKVKLADNKEHGLFIFGDLNAKIAGTFRLHFTLYEMRQGAAGWHAAKLTQLYSNEFRVMTSKEHAAVSPRESTSLSRTLSEAGVKLRIRKETSKRKAHALDWATDKRQTIPSLPPPNGSMPPPMMRWAAQDYTMQSPQSLSVLGRIGYDRQPPFGNNTILSDRSASHHDMRPPPLSSTYQSSDRSHGAATTQNGQRLLSHEANYSPYSPKDRATQRNHQTSQFDSSPTYDHRSAGGASESYYPVKSGEQQPGLSTNGYIPPQSNYSSYGGIQRAEQYNRDQRPSRGSTHEDDQSNYRTEYPLHHGHSTTHAEVSYSGSSYGQTTQAPTTNLAHQGSGDQRHQPYPYSTEQSVSQTRMNYSPAEQYSYSR